MSDLRESVSTRDRSKRIKEERARVLKTRVLSVCILVVLIVLVALSFVMCRDDQKVTKSARATTAQQTVLVEKINTKKHVEETTTKYDVYATEKIPESASYKVIKPKSRSMETINKILKKYAKSDARFKELYENRGNYTKSELNKAINNPEMADFIISYRTAKRKVNGGISNAEKAQDFPLFTQWDKRWGYVSYGDSNIGFAGCGPACLSMVIYSLTRDENVTPDTVAKFSESNGYYVNNVGTSWSLFKEGAESYNLKVSSLNITQKDMQKALDNGKILILAVGPGDFTTGGHFVVVYGYDNVGFKVNDPYCISRSKISYSFERLKKQIKTIWAYSKNV